jgi:VWFA-related protein
MMVRAARTAIGACAIGAWSVGAASQSPTFKSSIDLVRVDVNVVERANGTPIADLGRDDFVLTIDGRPRALTSAQFVRLDPSSGGESHSAAALTYTSNRAAQPGRFVMIVADTANLAAGRAKMVFRAASRFVASLDPADRVALATIPIGPQSNFTLNHALVQSALDKMDGRALANGIVRTVTIAEALAFERRDQFKFDEAVTRECGAPATSDRGGGSDFAVCLNQMQQEANVVAGEAHAQARNTIAALQRIVARLAAIDVPKTLIFVSEGLVIDREPSLLSWLSKAAAAAHLTLYALQVDRDGGDASNARVPVSRMADRAVQAEGLEAMAAFGRGDVFHVVAGADGAFERIGRELGAYYLLAFEPEPADRDGRPHQIRVATRRAGVVVRARPEFTVTAAAPKTTEQVLLEALQSPTAATSLPMTVTTYMLQALPPKVRVLIAADVGRGDGPPVDAMLGFVLVDENGRLTAHHSEALPRSDGADARGPYITAADVDPGVYTLKMAVADDVGRTGSVGRTFVATLAQFGAVRVSDLLLAAGDTASQRGSTNVIAAADIGAGPLRAAVQLVADTPSALANVGVTIEVAATETSPPLQIAAAQIADQGTHRAAEAVIRLTAFAPGEYVARAIVAVDGRTIGRIARPFRIGPAAHQP